MKPGWLESGRDWWERLSAFTEDDVSWFDQMWELTERPMREVDITPDPRLIRTIMG